MISHLGHSDAIGPRGSTFLHFLAGRSGGVHSIPSGDQVLRADAHTRICGSGVQHTQHETQGHNTSRYVANYAPNGTFLSFGLKHYFRLPSQVFCPSRQETRPRVRRCRCCAAWRGGLWLFPFSGTSRQFYALRARRDPEILQGCARPRHYIFMYVAQSSNNGVT